MTRRPLFALERTRWVARRFMPALGLVCGFAGAAEPSLRHDPFAWPAAVRPTGVVMPGIAKTSSAAVGAGLEAPTPTWQPRLRAIVNAGSASLVSVDGTVVALGEQIDGFRLVRVGERSATFAKGGVYVELKMDGGNVASR